MAPFLSPKSKRAITLLDDGPLGIGDCSSGLHHPVAVRLSLLMVHAAAVGLETETTGDMTGMWTDVASARRRAATWANRLVDMRNIGLEMLDQAGDRRQLKVGQRSGDGGACRGAVVDSSTPSAGTPWRRSLYG